MTYLNVRMSQAEDTVLEGRIEHDQVVTRLPEVVNAENSVRIFEEARVSTTDLFSHDRLEELVLWLLDGNLFAFNRVGKVLKIQWFVQNLAIVTLTLHAGAKRIS